MNSSGRAALIARLRDYERCTDKDVDDAADLLEAYAVPQEPVAWQQIETAPKKGVAILLWGKYWNARDIFQRPLIGMWNEDRNRWEANSNGWFGVHPTHWMPLPPAPDAAPQPQPAAPQEPVAWKTDTSSGKLRFTVGVQTFTIDYDVDDKEELKWMQEQLNIALSRLAAPQPQRPRLTDEEIKAIAESTKSAEPGRDGYILPFSFARAIEKKVRGEA